MRCVDRLRWARCALPRPGSRCYWFCKECILGVLQNGAARCPLCRGNLNPTALRAGVTAAEAAAAAAAAAAPEGAEGAEAAGEVEAAEEEQATVVESKLQALLKQLRAMRRADKTSKALVFSQFTTTIEWLKVRLTEEGFGYRFISGSMPLKQRAKAIQQFQADPPTTVFLISMRTGSVGINLTAADHVFLMEPCLNPALEDQAVGRSWRMGQARPVTVRRFYVQGSVEERIIEVVRQRQAAGVRPAGNHRANVRVQEAAGNIQADKQQLRMEELEQLFKDPELPAPREPEPSVDEDEEEELGQVQQEQQGVEMEDDDQPGTSAAHAARAGRAAGADRGKEDATAGAGSRGGGEGAAGVGGRRGVSRAAARRAMEQRRWCQQDGEEERSDDDI